MIWQEEYRKRIRLSSDWQKEYEQKIITADEAAQKVKSGDSVVFCMGREPLSIGLALAARKDELKGVRVFMGTPTFDFGWYDPGWQDSFEVTCAYTFPRGVAHNFVADKRGDYTIGGLYLVSDLAPLWNTDVALVEISAPDKDGFCSFGASVYDKRRWLVYSKLVMAEVNDRLVRTYGDNYVHVSQIDYFVMHPPSGRKPGERAQAGVGLWKPTKELLQMAGYVRPMIRNGDTVQVGSGGTSEGLVQAGVFEGKEALGWHSEVTPAGIIKLVREGVITGERKSIDRGKAVATAMGGGTEEEMRFVNMNPMFELRDEDYTHDPRTLGSLDNLVTINNVISVDFGGQIAAESLGPRLVSGSGGLLAFSLGANISRGGRAVFVLPSTAKKGTVSRIVPILEDGTRVSVPNILADTVVTEYGVAELKGKTQRQRAQAIIEIAHPDYRGEMRKAAKELYGP